MLWSLLWACMLAWIPSIIMTMRAVGKRYSLGDGALTFRTGLLSKKTEHVELYRVRNVSTSTSAFAGGNVVLGMQDGSSYSVGSIKDADQVGTESVPRSTLHAPAAM